MNTLLNLINHQENDNDDIIDKFYVNAKDPDEAKFQLLIIKRESVRLKPFNDAKAFIEY